MNIPEFVYGVLCQVIDGKDSFGPIQTKDARFFPSRFVRTRAFTPKQKNAGRRMNTRAVIGLDVITC